MAGSIVLALAFDALGEAAFQSALNLARDLRTKLILVHAFPTHFIPADVRPTTAKRLEKLEAHADLHEAVRLTTDWGARCQKEGVDFEAVAEPGEPAELVLRVAEERGGALIVVGTHGRRGLTRLLVGSVAEAIIRGSDRPVLVVPRPK